MKKAFRFVESLKSSFYDLMGYPTIQCDSEITEVYFNCRSTIRSFEIFTNLSSICYDEFRFFAGDGCITFVFTFYNDSLCED